MTTPKLNEPKPFVHSNENHRRAMRAMVDRLKNNNFDFWRARDELIYINIEGTYSPCGNEMLDAGNFEGDYVYFADFEYPWQRLNYGKFDHIVIVVEISYEIIEMYQNMIEAFDDHAGTGDLGYSPIEIVDDPKVECSWAMRILVDNLIKTDFDPTEFRTHPFYPFSLVVKPDEFTFNIRATARKNKHRFLSNSDGCSN
jgi:hypothetical protein